MKSRFNLYCTLLIVAVVFGFCVSFASSWQDFLEGFRAGYNEGASAQGMAVGGFSGFLKGLAQGTGALTMLVCIVWIWILFIKLVNRIKRGGVFDPETATHTRLLGLLNLACYAGQWLFTLCEWPGWRHLDIDHYMLYVGLGLLIVGEVLQIARELKQEQDLTV